MKTAYTSIFFIYFSNLKNTINAFFILVKKKTLFYKKCWKTEKSPKFTTVSMGSSTTPATPNLKKSLNVTIKTWLNNDVYNILVTQKITQLLSIEVEELLKISSNFHSNRILLLSNLFSIKKNSRFINQLF